MSDLATILYGEGSNNMGTVRETMQAILNQTTRQELPMTTTTTDRYADPDRYAEARAALAWWDAYKAAQGIEKDGQLGKVLRALVEAEQEEQRSPLAAAVADALADRYGDDSATVAWSRNPENEQDIWDEYLGPMLDDIREEH